VLRGQRDTPDESLADVDVWILSTLVVKNRKSDSGNVDDFSLVVKPTPCNARITSMLSASMWFWINLALGLRVVRCSGTATERIQGHWFEGKEEAGGGGGG